MQKLQVTVWVATIATILCSASFAAGEPPHPLKTWVKRHPRPGSSQPPPRMGYETSYGYDAARKLLIRYGGHNQGGGGEQNSEVWTYDLARDVWALREPNDAPPGVCCAQQNVFDDDAGRFIRFPAFSGGHGWQSRREIDLKNSSVWTYDLPTNTWRAMRPCPEIWPQPLRGAAYDPHHQITVLHGGENARYGTAAYDLYTNTWYSLDPPGGPEANISQPGFTYDPVNRVFVLFGSQFQDDERTWVYDLRKNTWRALDVGEHPPGKKSCPVLAADSRNGIILCSVQGQADSEGPSPLQTWVLDVAARRWTRLKVPQEVDPSGARNRVLVYLPDENLFVLENRTRDEQQIWTFRYADAPAAQAGPGGLRLTTDADGATLTWQPPGEGKWRYSVLRGRAARPWEAVMEPVREDVEETQFRDAGLQRGAVYYYQVRLAGPDGARACASRIARTQPPVPLDVVASVTSPRRVELQWTKRAAEDVVGYHVERADVAVDAVDQVESVRSRYRPVPEVAAARIRRIGSFRRLTPQPLSQTRFVDETIDLAAGQRVPADPPLVDRPLREEQLHPGGKPYPMAVYAYRVVAVNRLGVESGPSPLVVTYPAAVQHVFARELGKDQTQLRWQPHASKVAGYHVYRYDGRWDKDTIRRLTPAPIRATEFVDEQAGPGTRRYEVVAVDLLGQEGEPSQPVWGRREWQRFYVPYTGQWHQ